MRNAFMEQLRFSSVDELFNRLKPALRSKVAELKREGYNYLTVEDIWNYLKESKWKNSKNLALNEMVSDIFHSDNVLIDDYFKSKISRRSRRVYFDR